MDKDYDAVRKLHESSYHEHLIGSGLKFLRVSGINFRFEVFPEGNHLKLSISRLENNRERSLQI